MRNTISNKRHRVADPNWGSVIRSYDKYERNYVLEKEWAFEKGAPPIAMYVLSIDGHSSKSQVHLLESIQKQFHKILQAVELYLAQVPQFISASEFK